MGEVLGDVDHQFHLVLADQVQGGWSALFPFVRPQGPQGGNAVLVQVSGRTAGGLQSTRVRSLVGKLTPCKSIHKNTETKNMIYR